jgi:hypothetical protein
MIVLKFFENKEQIEVSKFYEKLPKPHALAVQEWLDGKIYHRDSINKSTMSVLSGSFTRVSGGIAYKTASLVRLL